MMIMMIMMTMTMMTTMRLSVSEMCFSGLPNISAADSKFDRLRSKHQDQLTHMLDEYIDCIAVRRDLDDDVLWYNRSILENGCSRSITESRSGQLC